MNEEIYKTACALDICRESGAISTDRWFALSCMSAMRFIASDSQILDDELKSVFELAEKVVSEKKGRKTRRMEKSICGMRNGFDE